ncbi:MAG: glycosyltransferase family 2 protein [Candidatus Woesearchaeota archaeon]
MNVLIGLPAYNEAPVITSVIKKIKKQGFDNILVIDECSTDNTKQEAPQTGAKVIRHVVNRGAGAATATLLSYALEQNYDYVIVMDSDGQHDPKDINKLLQQKQHNVVIGYRDFKGMPIQRTIANTVGNLVTWFFFGKLVKDSQSGFKMFDRVAMQNIHITFDRYEFCSQIIGQIRKHNLTLAQVPIKVIYTDHSLSKGQNILNGFKMIMRLLLRWNR